jgi:DNA-binding transcriptional LysR family regulator
MDIRQLKCFDAVLTTGAMTRAADLLGLSQPTVSITIAQLEREIGFTLFNRSKGWLEPTPEAFSFHHAAMDAIESISRVSQSAREIKRLSVGEISILCYPGIAWHLMPKLIAEFRSEHKGVQVKLVSRSSAALRQLIMAQNFDIAVVEAPAPQPTSKGVLFDYKCMCALPPDHPLNHKDIITPEDLDEMPFTMLFADHSTHHQIRAAFSEAGSNLNAALECDFFASACSFTQANGGVTIIDPITSSQINSKDLVLKPFEPPINYQLVLTRPTNRAKSRLSDEFYQRLRLVLKGLQ